MNKNFAVEVAGIQMKNPLMTASGTFGFGIEYRRFFDPNILGGIIVKAITLEPRDGNPGVRIAETPAGMLNAIGLENPGVDRFLKMILPNIKDLDTPIIVNVAGKTEEEYVEVARRLQVEGIAGLELNISCPNVKEGGIAFGSDPETADFIEEGYRRATLTIIDSHVTTIMASIVLYQFGTGPVRGLIHIGASTHPGPGLGGGSGFNAAKRLGA